MIPETRHEAGSHSVGWSPPGAADFLRGLIDGDETLRTWARGHPDLRWCEWLVGQGLAAYTWYRLKATGCADCLQADLRQALRSAYYLAVGDAELHTAELREVLAHLEVAGVTPILFKGASLAYTAYPDPACRPMGDLDLWVTADAMPRARIALAAAGYREHHKIERPVELQRQTSGEVQLIGTAPDQGLVELHWGTFAGEWVRRTTAVDDEQIRSRARPIQVAGRDARMLGAEDTVLQLAVHLAVSHQMAYPGVRGLLDVALLVKAEPIDWAALVERARAWRVTTPVWLVLSLTGQLFGLNGGEAAVKSVAPSTQRQALLRQFVDARSVLEGRDMTGGPRRLAFQLLLVDRTRDATRLVARTLWPEAEWLRLRYGDAGVEVRARHLASAVRGRI